MFKMYDFTASACIRKSQLAVSWLATYTDLISVNLNDSYWNISNL